MRKYLNYIALPVLAAGMLTGCFDVIPMAETVEPANARIASDVEATCFFDNRTTTATVNNREGEVLVLGSRENPKYVIQLMGTNLRYSPCDLPAAYMQNGTRVLFSGEEKQIMPNEKWAGRPFVLKSITADGASVAND